MFSNHDDMNRKGKLVWNYDAGYDAFGWELGLFLGASCGLGKAGAFPTIDHRGARLHSSTTPTAASSWPCKRFSFHFPRFL